jgi:hypothetical protein
MDAAVKTIRASQESSVDAIHEVRKVFRYLIPGGQSTRKTEFRTFATSAWMNATHPNILPLIAVKAKPDSGKFSMISEFMGDENILNYINDKRANRVRPARPLVVGALGQTTDWTRSWRTW